VDDPYDFGQIAAANALSDVYAMGATPRLATNIVCFPKELSIEVLSEILAGSNDKLKEAGVLLAGGHSVDDAVVKYGLSITGFVDPAKVVTNSGARAGDVLILTKPLGVGVLTGAIKAGKISVAEAAGAIESMKELNRAASEAMVEAGASACTDITGYGLAGHAMEMARGSGVSLILKSSGVKAFPRATEFIMNKRFRPRTLLTNRAYLAPDVETTAADEAAELLLYDPQTSGGLLISVAEEREAMLMERLRSRRVEPFVVGHVVERRADWLIRVE